VRLRGLPSDPHELYRLKGGNQALPDAFTVRLESRIRKNCPVTRIQYGDTGVTVNCTESGVTKKIPRRLSGLLDERDHSSADTSGSSVAGCKAVS